MLQWIQILDYADSYAYFVDYDAPCFSVREGLVPWDWLFLEKVKSIRNLGVASSISRGCWFGRDGSRLSWMKRFLNRPSLGKMEVIDFPAIWSSNFWKNVHLSQMMFKLMKKVHFRPNRRRFRLTYLIDYRICPVPALKSLIEYPFPTIYDFQSESGTGNSENGNGSQWVAY